MYDLMRYWDNDHNDWDEESMAFAAGWRQQPKWVASHAVLDLGPNAKQLGADLEGEVRRLKAEVTGEIEVAGPQIAHCLTELGLIDVYRLYVHPVVLENGPRYFAGPVPPLRLNAIDRIDDDVVRLTYVPA